MHEPSAGQSKVLTYRLLLCPCINIKSELFPMTNPKGKIIPKPMRLVVHCVGRHACSPISEAKVAPLAHGRQSYSKYHQASKS